MKHHNLIIFILLAVSFTGVNFANGQNNSKEKVKRDTINRELTVVTDKVIEIPLVKGEETDVIPTNPVLKPFSAKPIRQLAPFNPTASPVENGFISPIAKEGVVSPYRGYLDMGAGTMWNFRVGLGYRILSNPKDQLMINFRHRSNFETLDDETQTMETKNVAHSSTFKIDYGHRFNPLTLGLGMRYNYNFFNYYGVVALDRQKMSPKKKIDTDSNAGVHSFDFKIGVASNHDIYRVVDYKADLRILNTLRNSTYGIYKLNVGEFNPDLDLGFNVNKGGDFSWGVDANTGFINYTFNHKPQFINYPPEQTVMYDNDKSMFYVYGNPYVQLNGSDGNIEYFLKGGLGVSYNTGNSSKFFLYPEAEASLGFAKTYRIYAKATGGLMTNTLRQTIEEMPYVTPAFLVDPGRNKLDAIAGFSGAFTQYLALDLYGGYRMIDHHHFFTPFVNVMEQDEKTLPYLEDVTFRPVYNDAKELRLGARLSVNYKGLFGLIVKGEYNKWNDLDGGLVPDGMPSFVGEANVYFSPIEKLRIDINYRLKNGMQYNSFGKLEPKVIDLEDVHLLSVRANYKLNDKLNVYLNAENLLFRTYSMIYAYPARGASFMAGVDYKF